MTSRLDQPLNGRIDTSDSQRAVDARFDKIEAKLQQMIELLEREAGNIQVTEDDGDLQ